MGVGELKRDVTLVFDFLSTILRKLYHTVNEFFKYLGRWIIEDARFDEDKIARVEMAKAAFRQNKELMRRDIG